MKCTTATVYGDAVLNAAIRGKLALERSTFRPLSKTCRFAHLLQRRQHLFADLAVLRAQIEIRHSGHVCPFSCAVAFGNTLFIAVAARSVGRAPDDLAGT